MERHKKHNGRVRGKFLAAPPVIDLNSEKKDELLKDIFNKKVDEPAIPVDRKPIKISKLEKVALPVLIVAAVAVGWSLVFNLFFYNIRVDIKKEAGLSLTYFSQSIVKSIAYLRSDLWVVSSVTPSINLSAGIGFVGEKIADIAELGSLKTVSLIEDIK